ncbi:MAG: hypothetical protein ACI94Y_000497 [Maribacter sp.]|jgi:hypothetical protein
MRFVLGLILVALLAYISPMFLPWWGIIPLAGIVGFAVGAKWWQSFLYGLIAVAVVWGIYTYSINSANEGILSSKMAELFNIDGGGLLVLISTAIGAIFSALAALGGALLRDGILPVSDGNKKSRGGYSTGPKRKRRKTWR